MRDRFLDDCLIYEILFVAEEIPNETGEVKQEQQVLSSHRKDLLDALHACQTQIDCLDYLAWQIEKKGGRT